MTKILKSKILAATVMVISRMEAFDCLCFMTSKTVVIDANNLQIMNLFSHFDFRKLTQSCVLTENTQFILHINK